MTLTRPVGITKGLFNASDHRHAISGLVEREGLFADAVTTKTDATGVLFAGSGWSVSARAFKAASRRGNLATYGGALFANDALIAAAATVPAAPASGSTISRIYVMVTDPDNGGATSVPGGETVARAVPVWGVVSAASPTIPALPTGALKIGTVTVPSGATSLSSSGVVIAPEYDFAVLRGGLRVYRKKADLDADTTANSGNFMTGDRATILDVDLTFEWSRSGSRWSPVAGSLITGAVATTANISVPDGSARTTVSMATVANSAKGEMATSTSSLTVPYTGRYKFRARPGWGGNATGARLLSFYVNGAETASGVIESRGTAAAGSYADVTEYLDLNAGDSVRIGVSQTSGGALSFLAGSDLTGWWDGRTA